MKQTREIRLPAAVVPIGQPANPPVMARPLLRRLGFFQILLELKRRYPLAPRYELRAVAKKLNKIAWDGRDREAVAKLMR